MNMHIDLKCTCYLTILLTLINSSDCLYEDQIGKFDWKLNYIGKLKYSSFDSISNTKRIIVATEENVLAALNIKTGEILWRQVLETGSRGEINLLHVDSEIVTVTGQSPAIVRGWDSNTGAILWEWSLVLTSPERAAEAVWFVSEDILYHVVPVLQSHVELTEYNLRSGHNQGSSQKVLAQWNNMRCQLINSFYVCLTGAENNVIMSIDLLSEQLKVTSKHVERSIDSTIKPLTGSMSGVILDTKIYLLSRNEITEFPSIFRRDASFVSIKNSNEDIILQSWLVKEELFIEAYTLTGSKLEIGSPVVYSNTLKNPVLSSAICGPRKDSSLICRSIYGTEDHVTMLVQHPGKILWHREESLSHIVDVQMIDLPLSDEEGIQNAHKNKGDISGMLIHRITNQIGQFKVLLMAILGVEYPAQSKTALVRDAFGLHKLIVLATNAGKIFGIDNANGQIYWSRNLPDISTMDPEHNIKLILQRTSRHYPHQSQCTVLAKHKSTHNGILIPFNPITGALLNSESGVIHLPYPIRQFMLLPEDINFLKALLILDTHDKPHVYPPLAENEALGKYIFTINSNTGLATGFLIEDKNGIVATPVWSLQLTAPGHRVSHVAAKSKIERVHSQGRVLGDRSVLYKYVNPHLVAVITQGPDIVHKYILNIILLDVVSGVIVFSATHRRARDPVHIVHSENWLVYSYFNEKARRTEIGTMELYEGKTQFNSTVWSSYNAPQPMVERQAFIFPAQIDALKETITEKGITSKHMLFGLNSGSVLEMPWIFLDPRRPLAPSSEAREEGILPYVPELPIPSEGIINYNQSVSRMRDIYTAPSGLESTCLVLVHGLDIYYTRVAPSQTFDLLKDDFDYLMISVVLTVLVLSALITKHLSTKKALKQAWK